MKKIVILISLFCIGFQSYAQGEANFWYFGYGAGIDFNTGAPVSISGNLNTIEGCSSFSDSNGNLLFYSDGTNVWDKNGNVMTNGQNMLGNPSSSQSAIIVPNPSNANLFYIFTVGANEYDNTGNIVNPTQGLQAYTVDMTANGGLGDVVGVPIDLSIGRNQEWTEKVTAVKGADCNTFWIISLVKDTFVAYKIDTNGLNTTPVLSTVNYTANDPRGYLKVSPDGTKLACATYNNNSGNLLLYSFDDTTGTVANDALSLISNSNIDGSVYGVEFSPQSTRLYCSTFDGANNRIFQFDLQSADIISSKTLINSQIGFRGALQLAPDGKIYAVVPIDYFNGTSFLDAINAPNELGAACNYQVDALDLGANVAMQGLPPFIASILLPIEITDGNSNQNLNQTTAKRCAGENYQLVAQNIQGNPTYNWTFNGVTISTTANLSLPNLSSTDAGTYYLEVQTIDNCGVSIIYQGEVTLEVYTPPTSTQPTDILQCDDDNDGFFSFDLNALKDAEILNGQSPTEFEVHYFTNQADADANTNPIANPYTNASAYSSDVIVARIQNSLNSTCYQTQSFTIQVFESPTPAVNIPNLTTCDSNAVGTDTDGFEAFDLTVKQTEILNGQNPTDFTVTYFTDSNLTNQIANPTSFVNTNVNSQTIYVSVVNNANNTCEASTSFIIEVLPLPTINASFLFKQCDEDGNPDGFTDFNLDEANTYITLGDNTLTVTYFLSFNDADTNTNPINPAPYSNATQATVFARVENTVGCHRVAQVDLLVSATSFPPNYLKTLTQCDDDDTIDGLHLFDLAQTTAEIIALFPSGQNLAVSFYRNLADAQLEVNQIPTNTPYMSETPFSQTIYVRVESNDNGECFGLGPYLQLVVNPRPEFELDPTAIYCQNLPPATIAIFNPLGNYTYQWTFQDGTVVSNRPEVRIDREGVYTVIATSQFGCESFPHSITITPSIIATVTYDDITVVDDSENNSITIATNSLGIGDYEFAIDDRFGPYQDEPFFDNVAPGIHTIFIRDKNDCGIALIDVSVIGFPRYFTPNGDGVNDTWKILGVNESFYASSNIYIFDRFGKLIAKIDPRGNGWNGIFNGKFLPASDYWFSVELIDNNGNIRTRKGHFSLIRR